MAMANEQVVEVLNRLIQTCKDGENGFRTAAGGVKTPELKHLFESYSSERARFASELQAEVQRLGSKPQDSGSVAGVLHRGWINIKAMVTGQHEAAIITECVGGEDAAMKTYEEASQSGLPEAIQSVVARQLDQVREAHARVRALQEVTAKA